MIYLDNAATTYPKPEMVYKALDKSFRKYSVNIGRGSYKRAREAYEIYDDTKKRLKKLVNASNSKVIFEASATDSFNSIIRGLNIPENSNVYITPFEHNAVARTLKYYSKKNNFNINLIPYNNASDINKEKFINMCVLNKPDYLFVNHVSNVTGYITDLNRILEVLDDYDVIKILDASQSLGLVDIDFDNSGFDHLIFAGHKTLYGPFGIAGYITNAIGKITPTKFGGDGRDSLNIKKWDNFEVGSKNINAIIGLNESLKWIEKIGVKKIFNHKLKLTKILSEKLSGIYEIEPIVNNNRKKQIGIISFNHKNYYPDEVADILDNDFNIAVRSGYHCAPYIHDLLNTKNKGGTVRVSFGYFNNKESIDRLIESLDML